MVGLIYREIDWQEALVSGKENEVNYYSKVYK